MANELQLQKLVVDAYRQNGGFGFKLSNRFLVGVPDLLLHHRETGTGIWEVKVQDQPKKAPTVKLPLTPLQKKFLEDFQATGGTAGVISFLRGKHDLLMYAGRYSVVAYQDSQLQAFRVAVSSHTVLPRGHREKTIMEIMERVTRYAY